MHFKNKLLQTHTLLAALLIGLAGCATQHFNPIPPESLVRGESIQIREGDTLRINFPSAATLNTTQQVRRDGNISLFLVGELKVVGLTPAELQKQLLKLYDKQLVTEEVLVTIENSTFPIFVTGAVIRPGKIMVDHPMTALEAIMEAGGFDYAKANLKKVTVIRTDPNHTEQFRIDLKGVLEGSSTNGFYLNASDIIYVPEKFNWF